MKEIIRKIKVKLGWIDCPSCGNFIKPRWEKDWIIDPEEPPMFYHYECPKCFARTDIEPTLITEKAVRNLGYDDFKDFANKNILQNEMK